MRFDTNSINVGKIQFNFIFVEAVFQRIAEDYVKNMHSYPENQPKQEGIAILLFCLWCILILNFNLKLYYLVEQNLDFALCAKFVFSNDKLLCW